MSRFPLSLFVSGGRDVVDGGFTCVIRLSVHVVRKCEVWLPLKLTQLEDTAARAQAVTRVAPEGAR